MLTLNTFCNYPVKYDEVHNYYYIEVPEADFDRVCKIVDESPTPVALYIIQKLDV
jgi:hypothetical protein